MTQTRHRDRRRSLSNIFYGRRPERRAGHLRRQIMPPYSSTSQTVLRSQFRPVDKHGMPRRSRRCTSQPPISSGVNRLSSVYCPMICRERHEARTPRYEGYDPRAPVPGGCICCCRLESVATITATTARLSPGRLFFLRMRRGYVIRHLFDRLHWFPDNGQTVPSDPGTQPGFLR